MSKAKALLSSEPGLIKSVVDGRTPLLAAVHYHHHEHEVVLICSLPSSWGARGQFWPPTIIIIITPKFEHEPKRWLKIKYDQNWRMCFWEVCPLPEPILANKEPYSARRDTFRPQTYVVLNQKKTQSHGSTWSLGPKSLVVKILAIITITVTINSCWMVKWSPNV